MNISSRFVTFTACLFLVIGASSSAIGEEVRKKPWEAVDLGGGSAGGGSNASEKSAGQVSGGTLSSTWEGIEGNPSYEILTQQIDNNEQILEDMENRIGALENGGAVADNWVTQPPTQSGTETVAAGAMQASLWEPAISGQTASFMQARSVTEDKAFPMEIYEYNTTTGERRLVESYTENKERTFTETRTVNYRPGLWKNETISVTTNTVYGPVTSEEPNTFNCVTAADPADYDMGQTVYTERTCDINRSRTVNYTAPIDGGSAWQTETLATVEQTQVGELTQNWVITGTKPVEPECRPQDMDAGNWIFAANTGTGTNKWGNGTIYEYINLPPNATITAEKPMVRVPYSPFYMAPNPYHYWMEDAYVGSGGGSGSFTGSAYICRVRQGANTEWGGSVYYGGPM